jgi:hypothetical protein
MYRLEDDLSTAFSFSKRTAPARTVQSIGEIKGNLLPVETYKGMSNLGGM